MGGESDQLPTQEEINYSPMKHWTLSLSHPPLGNLGLNRIKSAALRLLFRDSFRITDVAGN
jgi:hypothetical protein